MLALVLISGCGKKQANEIKIGTISPLTGAGALYGKKLTQAVDMAFAEANEKGGIRGKKLVAVHEDDKLEPNAAIAAAQKLISIDKVPVIIGAVASSATLAVAPKAEAAKVVLITPISSAVAISDAGDYVFRIAPSDAFLARDAARWIKESGYTKVSVIYINNDYGLGIQRAFARDFAKLGGTVLSSEGFAQGSNDLRAPLTKAKALSPEAIFVPSYMEEAGRLLRQKKELGVGGQVFGTDPFHDPLIFQGAGDAADGAWFLDVASGSGLAYDEFAKKYKAKYNMDADIIAAESYDAALAVIMALEAAGSEDPTAIKDAMYKVKFDGASGRTEFDAKGDVPSKTFQRFKVVGEKYEEWKK